MTSSDKVKDRRLRAIYNTTLEAQTAQKAEQNNACAICDRPFPPFKMFQDHEHRCCPRKLKAYCGKCNRGLLCFQCNKYLIGVIERMMLNEDYPLNPQRFVDYLSKWTAVLTERGCYEPKPKKASSKVPRKQKGL